MSILPEIEVNTVMLYVSHPVAYILNERLTINDVFYCKIINNDYKIWFIYYDIEWRGQKLEET